MEIREKRVRVGAAGRSRADGKGTIRRQIEIKAMEDTIKTSVKIKGEIRKVKEKT